jgi:hypothetical protein
MDPPVAHLWRVQSARSVSTEASHVEIAVQSHQLSDLKTGSLDRYHVRTAARSSLYFNIGRKSPCRAGIGECTDVLAPCGYSHPERTRATRSRTATGRPSPSGVASTISEQIWGRAGLAADKVKAWTQLGAYVKVRDRGGEGEGCKKLTWRIHRGVTADVRGRQRKPMRLGNGPAAWPFTIQVVTTGVVPLY